MCIDQNWISDILVGFSREDIQKINTKLEELLIQYPNVIIKEIGDFYSRDIKSYHKLIETVTQKNKLHLIDKLKLKEPTFDEKSDGTLYKDDRVNGKYDDRNKSIYFNHTVPWKRDTMSMKKFDWERKNHYRVYNEIDGELKLLNDKELKHLIPTRYSFGNVLELVVEHEFAHAIDYQYGVYDDDEINKLFNTIPHDEIKRQLTDYAIEDNDIHEFIAEGFVESRLDNPSKLGKDIGKIINRVYLENRPMSTTERFLHKKGLL